MARAKRELHTAGLPTSAWAGVVVLGDGARTPWPDGASRGRSTLLSAAVVVAVLAAGSFLLFFFRRRSVG